MFFFAQLYLLFFVLTPPPDWASLFFCRWKFDLPVYLEIQWECVCFLPAAGVPLVYKDKIKLEFNIIDRKNINKCCVYLRLTIFLLPKNNNNVFYNAQIDV
jgi:hypothetical protein